MYLINDYILLVVQIVTNVLALHATNAQKSHDDIV